MVLCVSPSQRPMILISPSLRGCWERSRVFPQEICPRIVSDSIFEERRWGGVAIGAPARSVFFAYLCTVLRRDISCTTKESMIFFLCPQRDLHFSSDFYPEFFFCLQSPPGLPRLWEDLIVRRSERSLILVSRRFIPLPVTEGLITARRWMSECD